MNGGQSRTVRAYCPSSLRCRFYSLGRKIKWVVQDKFDNTVDQGEAANITKARIAARKAKVNCRE